MSGRRQALMLLHATKPSLESCMLAEAWIHVGPAVAAAAVEHKLQPQFVEGIHSYQHLVHDGAVPFYIIESLREKRGKWKKTDQAHSFNQ